MDKTIELPQGAAGEDAAVSNFLRKLNASEAQEQAEPHVQFAVVAVHGTWYGIRIALVREILKVRKMTRVPCTPECIIGVINVRGDIETVVDLKRLLGFGSAQVTASSRIVLVESRQEVVGVLVDEMIDIIQVPESTVSSVPESGPAVTPPYLTGQILWNETVIPLLNIDAIIQGIVVDDA